MISGEFDVIVVGGGPGGSTAAKKCAEESLKTLLVEKRKLPRDKVCTGMIMSEMSQTLVREVFGDLPERVLTIPTHLLGLTFRVRGAEPLIFERRMPFLWRKDFDYWMNQIAEGAGVELWDKSKVKSITENEKGYVLRVEREGGTHLIKARFLIGADGTVSTVRKALFPDVKMRYQLCVRQCYQGSLNLDPRYVHYFFLSDLKGFNVNCKDDVFLLEMTPRSVPGAMSNMVKQAEEWLIQDFGFTPATRPLWRDGCVEPSMTRKPFSCPFPLAKGNALLVGNAAGLTKPITGEGIGTALMTGLMAAGAVIEACKKGEKADKFYLPMAQDLAFKLGCLYPVPGSLRKESNDSFLLKFNEIYSRITNVL